VGIGAIGKERGVRKSRKEIPAARGKWAGSLSVAPPPGQVKEFCRGHDRHALAPAVWVVLKATSDEKFGAAAEGGLERHVVVGVG